MKTEFNNTENEALSIARVSSSIFGGLKKYFIDLEKYEESLYCSECGEDDKKIFTYSRTTSNGEVWRCDNCDIENITSKKPNEDHY